MYFVYTIRTETSPGHWAPLRFSFWGGHIASAGDYGNGKWRRQNACWNGSPAHAQQSSDHCIPTVAEALAAANARRGGTTAAAEVGPPRTSKSRSHRPVRIFYTENHN